MLASDDYELEVVNVKPFKKITHEGWILTFRSIKNPAMSFQSWLTLKTGITKYYWQIEQTIAFLEAAGFGETDRKDISHRELIGAKVWARVEKRPSKRGDFYNMVRKYHKEPPKDELPDGF